MLLLNDSYVQRNFRGQTIDTGVRMGTYMAYLRPALARLSSEVRKMSPE